MTHHESHERALVISEHAYKALLAAYPKGFRSEYGSQMAQAFRDSCREELGRGGIVGLAKLWIHTCASPGAVPGAKERAVPLRSAGLGCDLSGKGEPHEAFVAS